MEKNLGTGISNEGLSETVLPAQSKCPLSPTNPVVMADLASHTHQVPHTFPGAASQNSKHCHRLHPTSYPTTELVSTHFTAQALGVWQPGKPRGSGAVRNAGGESRRGTLGAENGWRLGEWALILVLPFFFFFFLCKEGGAEDTKSRHSWALLVQWRSYGT